MDILKLFYFLIITLLIVSCSENEVNLKQNEEVFNLKITSPAFEHNTEMPSRYTCDGEGVSPPLTISDIPENTKSLVLINDDPDAPGATWDHWIIFNMPPDTKEIPENTEPEGIAGKNSWGNTGYGGPCPPSGTHRYFFKIYALDTYLDLPESSSKSDIENAMNDHILDKDELIGLYRRK